MQPCGQSLAEEYNSLCLLEAERFAHNLADFLLYERIRGKFDAGYFVLILRLYTVEDCALRQVDYVPQQRA